VGANFLALGIPNINIGQVSTHPSNPLGVA